MSNARNLGNITAGGATGATTASVTTSINNLIDAAPGALNTLNELAAALGDDANFSTTITNSVALKATIDNPTFTTKITTPDIDITGGSQIGQDYAYLKSSSTTNTSLTLRKDSSGADSIDYLQLRSDGNGLISKITGAGALGAGAGTVFIKNGSATSGQNRLILDVDNGSTIDPYIADDGILCEDGAFFASAGTAVVGLSIQFDG